jgi:hypothetical protein
MIPAHCIFVQQKCRSKSHGKVEKWAENLRGDGNWNSGWGVRSYLEKELQEPVLHNILNDIFYKIGRDKFYFQEKM